MKIFVSYASEDRGVAEPVAFALSAEGHDVFFDRDRLPAGVGYNERIRDAIDTADLFVFLLSPFAVDSGSYTLTEIDLARARWSNPAGRMLPVLIAPTPTADIPAWILAVTLLSPKGNVPAEVAAAVARLHKEQPAASAQPGRPTIDSMLVDKLLDTQRGAVRWWRMLTLFLVALGIVVVAVTVIVPHLVIGNRPTGMALGAFVSTLGFLPARAMLRNNQKLEMISAIRIGLGTARGEERARLESLVWDNIRRLMLA